MYNWNKIIVALESFIWVIHEVLWTGKMNLLSFSTVPILYHMFHTVFSSSTKISFKTVSFPFFSTVQILNYKTKRVVKHPLQDKRLNMKQQIQLWFEICFRVAGWSVKIRHFGTINSCDNNGPEVGSGAAQHFRGKWGGHDLWKWREFRGHLGANRDMKRLITSPLCCKWTFKYDMNRTNLIKFPGYFLMHNSF